MDKYVQNKKRMINISTIYHFSQLIWSQLTLSSRRWFWTITSNKNITDLVMLFNIGNAYYVIIQVIVYTCMYTGQNEYVLSWCPLSCIKYILSSCRNDQSLLGIKSHSYDFMMIKTCFSLSCLSVINCIRRIKHIKNRESSLT